MSQTYVKGDRVVYVGSLSSLKDKVGTFEQVRVSTPGGDKIPMANVCFDGDDRVRVVELNNLKKEIKTMTNFKTLITDALTKLFVAITTDSPKERAVRRYGVAAETIRQAEVQKKIAKTELTNLGVFGTGYAQGSSEVVFDSPNYRVTAETKNASSRLDAECLAAALNAEGLSFAMQRRIIAGSTISNKAATSFKVEAK